MVIWIDQSLGGSKYLLFTSGNWVVVSRYGIILGGSLDRSKSLCYFLSLGGSLGGKSHTTTKDILSRWSKTSNTVIRITGCS